MNEQEQIAMTLHAVLPDLSVDEIESKIERPKDSNNGDFAFPTFFLAKSLHKAPQAITADLIAQLDTVRKSGPSGALH